MNKNNSITIIDRAAIITQSIAESDRPMGVSELSSKLDIPKATVFRIINALVQNNYLLKTDDEKYELSLLWVRYGEKVKSDNDILTLAKPFMKQLSKDTGETVNLGIRNEDVVVNILSVPGESSILISKLLPVSQLYCSAMGKQYLAQMTESDLKKYFSQELKKNTINTITSHHDFLQEKKKINQNKISFDNEEYEYGLCCIAAPLYDKSQNLIATINISGPITRIKMKGIDNLAGMIMDASNKITEKFIEACL